MQCMSIYAAVDWVDCYRYPAERITDFPCRIIV